MSENLEPNPQQEGISPYQPQPKAEITSSKLTSSDLDDIGQSLAERIKKGGNIEEIQKVVSVLSSVEDLKERRIKQDIVKLHAQEARNEIKFRRKIETTEIVSKKIFGAVGVGIGVYLISNTPLLAPLLIIIGLSGVLNFKLKDVSELLSNMNNNRSDLSEEENND